MQFLFHSDFIIDALRLESDGKKRSAVMELYRQKKIQGWVLSAAVPKILEHVLKDGEEVSANNAVNKFFKEIPILSLSAEEIREAVLDQGTALDISLAALAVKAFGLDGVVTSDPGAFSRLDVNALKPEELPPLLEQGKRKVDRVSLLDITASYPEIWNDVEKEMAEVIRTGRFILGGKVAELEEKIAAYCQSKFAVGVSSGTDALLISLMAAGIGPGDEVITTPYTFFATVGSIARVGARAVLVDIDEWTYNIDADQIEKKISKKTKAIIPVHLYGQCAEMEPILELARKHDLAVIEDAAQAIGSEYAFKRAGSMGDYGCFSFFPTKNLGGFGDGGIVTTSSEPIYEKLKVLRVHGSKPKYFHKVLGGNFRLDALQAAVVSAKLKYLEGWTKKRRGNADIYRRLFDEAGLLDRVQLPREVFPRHIYNQFVIRVEQGRDELKTFLKENKIDTEIYYPEPMHLQECFSSLGYRGGDFPNAEKAAKETLALPISHEKTPEELEYVVSNIKNFFA